MLLFTVEITHDSVDEFRLDIITLLVGLGVKGHRLLKNESGASSERVKLD